MREDEIYFSESILSSLDIYIELIKKWQKNINLVSKNSIDHLWNRHVIDSAQLYSLLPAPKKGLYIYDIGSGAGFPGMVLGIMGRKDIILCESNKRKCEFLKEVSRITNTNISIANTRAQKLEGGSALAITSRALASLDALLEISMPILREKGVCVFPKGRTWKEELTVAEKKFIINYNTVQSITSSDSKIIIITKVRKKYGN